MIAWRCLVLLYIETGETLLNELACLSEDFGVKATLIKSADFIADALPMS